MTNLTAQDITTLAKVQTPLQKALVRELSKNWREEYRHAANLQVHAKDGLLPSTETLSWGLGPAHPSHPRLVSTDQLRSEVAEGLTQDEAAEQLAAFDHAIKLYRAWEERERETLTFSTHGGSLEEAQVAWRAANFLTIWGLQYQIAREAYESGKTSTFGEALPLYHPSNPQIGTTDQLRRELDNALVGVPADEAQVELDALDRALPIYLDWEISLA